MVVMRPEMTIEAIGKSASAPPIREEEEAPVRVLDQAHRDIDGEADAGHEAAKRDQERPRPVEQREAFGDPLVFL
jgi:hypothetical protein